MLTAVRLRHHKVLVGVKHHIYIFFLLHKVFPCQKFKPVMNHHILILWQKLPQPVISPAIKISYKFHRVGAGTFRHVFIHGRITFRYIYLVPRMLCNRLI